MLKLVLRCCLLLLIMAVAACTLNTSPTPEPVVLPTASDNPSPQETVSSDVPVIRGEVTITPNEGMLDNWLQLMPGATVEVLWADAETPTHVEFYFAPTGTGIIPELIGTDSTGEDGWAISWTVPTQGVMGYWNAKAYFADGSMWETASLGVYAPA
ncbi:MAG: hypothetical protein K8L97_18510 [Anaerolineae bacterium]|nr:hypothetical protein [Anaerolineae bacterium]